MSGVATPLSCYGRAENADHSSHQKGDVVDLGPRVQWLRGYRVTWHNRLRCLRGCVDSSIEVTSELDAVELLCAIL